MDKIIYFGKNEYLVLSTGKKNILFKFYFDENINEYLYKTYDINIEKDILNIFVLDNNDIIVISVSHVYIFTIDYSSNSLLRVRLFYNLNTSNHKPTLLKMKNGNFIINFSEKLIYFSKSYEIISIFKTNDNHFEISDMIKVSNENIIFSYTGNSYLLSINTFKFSLFGTSEPIFFGINDNILGKIESESAFNFSNAFKYEDYFTLFDYKLNKSIYKENFDSYYWVNARFILIDENKNIFGFISTNSNDNTFMKIFQLKN